MSVIRWRDGAAFLRATVTSDGSLDWSVLDEDTHVPNTNDGLRRWLKVVSGLCSTRDFLNYPFDVVYSGPLSSYPRPRIEIRVQGVLEKGALASGVLVTRPISSGWERVRWVRLVCDIDDHQERFQEQVRILRAVADACKAQVGLPPSQLSLPDAVHLRRREPEGKEPVVPLNIFEIRESSRLLEELPVDDLGVGDILDIRAFVDIAVYRGDDTLPRTAVYFSFDEIVRVAQALGPHITLDPALPPDRLDERYFEADHVGYDNADDVTVGQDEELLETLNSRFPPMDISFLD